MSGKNNILCLNNGGCNIVVIMRGCGPRNEGSIPSFHPFFNQTKTPKNPLFLELS